MNVELLLKLKNHLKIIGDDGFDMASDQKDIKEHLKGRGETWLTDWEYIWLVDGYFCSLETKDIKVRHAIAAIDLMIANPENFVEMTIGE